MEKKVNVVIVSFLLILVVATVGCIDTEESIEDEFIFIDPDNAVMYGVYGGGVYAGIGAYDIVNADGTPKILNEPLKTKSNNINYIANKYSIELETCCYVDTQTGVMYLRVFMSKNIIQDADVVIVMLNPDGTPKTFIEQSNKYYDVTILQDEPHASMFVDTDTGVVYLHLYNSYIPMLDKYGNYKVVSS